jgi:superfamily I DNA/RNA helicase
MPCSAWVGLEFDDVLLYDFFASSPASTKQWRVINSDNLRDFDKHQILESELKRLYVAITRARHHCWIWESKPLQHPMIVSLDEISLD